MTDKFCMLFFELPKVPKTISKDDKLKLWLSLFNAETEEELKQIENLEVAEMEQASEWSRVNDNYLYPSTHTLMRA